MQIHTLVSQPKQISTSRPFTMPTVLHSCPAVRVGEPASDPQHPSRSSHSCAAAGGMNTLCGCEGNQSSAIRHESCLPASPYPTLAAQLPGAGALRTAAAGHPGGLRRVRRGPCRHRGRRGSRRLRRAPLCGGSRSGSCGTEGSAGHHRQPRSMRRCRPASSR